jgi:hypothetical protein
MSSSLEIEKIIKDNFNNIEKQVSEVVRNYMNNELTKMFDRFSFTKKEESKLVENDVQDKEQDKEQDIISGHWKKINNTTYLCRYYDNNDLHRDNYPVYIQIKFIRKPSNWLESIEKLFDKDNKKLNSTSHKKLNKLYVETIELKWYNKGKLNRSSQNEPSIIIITKEPDNVNLYFEYNLYYKNNILEKSKIYHYD